VTGIASVELIGIEGELDCQQWFYGQVLSFTLLEHNSPAQKIAIDK
jgi:hypothetical protein